MVQRLLSGVAPPLQLVSSTTDRNAALARTRPEAGDVRIKGVVAKLVDARYRPCRTDAWVKVRQVTVVNAVVVGVAGDPDELSEVVLARRDAVGAWRQIGLSLPLAPRLGRQIGVRITLTGEPAADTSAGGLGRGRTQYLPVRPEVFVEAETVPAVESFSSPAAAARAPRAARSRRRRRAARPRRGERRLVLSNLDKPLYSKGFCKAEVVPYYTHVAPFLLPHISRRPGHVRAIPRRHPPQRIW
ncbi:hypothetical protein [Amycolatopsis sp. NPDC051372]|uniref:hypothetical protein n=1 Tax=Amycolatopsis sp. NPDC051372 TaxID=3155669 RepID=UPI003449AF07